jgi:hypothetical protein
MDDSYLNRIIDEISSKSALTKEEISSLIQKKKSSIGSGYLTDTGAAYLVASDLGLTLSEIKTKIYKLNELISGLNSVNVYCHFLMLSQSRTFMRKDGTISEYFKMLVFDDRIINRVLIWNAETINKLDQKIGEPIILENVNTRLGRDRKIEIHTTETTKIRQQSDTPKTYKVIIKEVREINNEENDIVVSGVLSSKPRIMEFNSKDNSIKNAVSFLLSDRSSSVNLRVVIWTPTTEQLDLLVQNKEIVLINVKCKIGRERKYEIHGDADTKIIVTEDKDKRGQVENQFIVLSLGAPNIFTSSRTLLLGNGNNIMKLTVSNEDVDLVESLNIGDIIEIKNYYIKNDQILLNNFQDNTKLIGSDESALSKFTVNIKGLQERSTPIIIELVALSKSITKTIKLRNGKSILKTELLVGDETGEAQLFGWENQGKQLVSILPGTRLLVYGALPAKQFDGSFSLQCREYTQVKRIMD